MSHSDHDASDNATIHAIMTSLRACYGSLDKPNFRKVSETLRRDPYRPLVESLRSSEIEITDSTDLNNDVSVRLVLDRSEDSWVTQQENAPTPLAALVAQAVQAAGFKLLDRGLVSQKVKMSWYDGSEEVTLYQALFTDSDIIP